MQRRTKADRQTPAGDDGHGERKPGNDSTPACTGAPVVTRNNGQHLRGGLTCARHHLAGRCVASAVGGDCIETPKRVHAD